MRSWWGRDQQSMPTAPRLLDVVALLSDVPAHGLLRGQVGTVVELLEHAYEVEFSDEEGKTPTLNSRCGLTSSWFYITALRGRRRAAVHSAPHATPPGARVR